MNMIKSTTINIGVIQNIGNTDGVGIIGNIIAATPCHQGV